MGRNGRFCRWTVLALTFALMLGPWVGRLRAQEVSVLVQSMDNIEKRLNKVEADLQKIKKAGPPVNAGSAVNERKEPSARADSTAAKLSSNLSSNLDSLKWKLELLASKVAKLDARRDSLDREGLADGLGKELGSLALEVKGLTAVLKSSSGPGATSPAKFAEGTTAVTSASAVSVSPPKPAEVVAKPPKPDLVLSGNVQIHGERKVTAAQNRDNLDLFWGRINIGLDYKDEQLQSKINVRIFPDGFGFEPLTGVTFDTVGQGSVKTKTEPQAKVQINNAWVRYSWPDIAVRVGRIEMHDGPSESYGFYIDEDPSGKFMSRKPGSGHNALEFTSQKVGFATSMILAAADKNLDRGYLRLQEKYQSPLGFQAGLGYRSNVFDQWRFPEDEIIQRFDATLAYEIRKGILLFGESAMLQVQNRKEDDRPLLIGVQFPAAQFADLVSLEAEFLSNRQVKTGSTLEDKTWLFNAYGRKKFFSRLNFEMGIFSDASRADAAALGMGLRMTSAIK